MEPGGASHDFDRSVSPPISTKGKFFTYVTKPRAHLSTYSRKLGNYNDTIIFEIDIIKKQKRSSPLIIKIHIFCHSQNQNNTSLQCHSLYAQQKTAETITYKTTKTFVKKSQILIDWGGLFHDINLEIHSANVIPQFSTICG